MAPNPRYAGKPLLRLIECYILWAIDELPDDEAASLAAMTPKLQALYGIKGAWPAIIASTVGMGPDMAAQLKAMWRRNREIALANDMPLAPQQFAEMVVDENFAD